MPAICGLPVPLPFPVGPFSPTPSSSAELPSPADMWEAGKYPKVGSVATCGESLDPGPESRTMALPSDHQMGPGWEPCPSGRQFQTFPASQVGRGQRSVLRVHPGTRKESLGTERGPAAGPAPPGPLLFSPSGPVAPPLQGQTCARL